MGTKHNNKDVETQTYPEVKTEPNNNTKYIQILFYYVQDSSLFQVLPPNMKAESENFFVSILQFSPRLISVHANVMDICFVSNVPAVSKILFKSLFGPTVLTYFLVLYVIQKIMSPFLWKHSQVWCRIRSSLVHAFLLTILFAYQGVVAGAFSLVQCAEGAGGRKVMYIQGNIECFTWWQYATEIYIFVSVIPTFLVLSHLPFCVKNKTMSVGVFLLACLFPIPVLFCACVSRIRSQVETSTREATGVDSVGLRAPLASPEPSLACDEENNDSARYRKDDEHEITCEDAIMESSACVEPSVSAKESKAESVHIYSCGNRTVHKDKIVDKSTQTELEAEEVSYQNTDCENEVIQTLNITKV